MWLLQLIRIKIQDIIISFCRLCSFDVQKSSLGDLLFPTLQDWRDKEWYLLPLTLILGFLRLEKRKMMRQTGIRSDWISCPGKGIWSSFHLSLGGRRSTCFSAPFPGFWCSKTSSDVLEESVYNYCRWLCSWEEGTAQMENRKASAPGKRGRRARDEERRMECKEKLHAFAAERPHLLMFLMKCPTGRTGLKTRSQVPRPQNSHPLSIYPLSRLPIIIKTDKNDECQMTDSLKPNNFRTCPLSQFEIMLQPKWVEGDTKSSCILN